MSDDAHTEAELLERGALFADFFRGLLPADARLAKDFRATWAKIYRDLRKLDERTDRQIVAVCRWARGHSFWRRNFLTPAKLRQRNGEGVFYFDVFAEAMRADAGDAPAMPRHEFEACEAAHRAFCEAAKRGEPFRLHAGAWRALLSSPEFAGLGAHPEDCEAAGLERAIESVRLVVKFLARGIARGDRQPGALKLSNFLQPARFFADLAEARRFARGLAAEKPARQPAPVALPAAGLRPATDEERKEIAGRLRALIDDMREGRA